MSDVSRHFCYGAQWIHDGRPHTLVAVQLETWPSTAVLREDSTGAMVDVPLIAAMAEHSHWMTPESAQVSDQRAHLDLLSPRNRSIALQRAAHIREALCGSRTGDVFDPHTCRSQYDPARWTRAQRIQTKIDELSGQRGYGRSSVYALIDLYDSSGGSVAALAPGRIPTPHDPRDGISADAIDTIRSLVAQLNSEKHSTMTLDAKLTRLRVELDAAGVIDPALTARRLRKLLDLFQRGIPQNSAVERRNRKSRNTSGIRRPRPSQPLERVEIDATQLNHMVFDPDSGQQFRPYLLVAACCATKLFHVRLCPLRPTTRDVRLLIFDMMRPLVLPDVTRDHLIAIGVPQQLVIRQTDEIGTIVIDNGGEMVGVSIIDLARRFGIDIEGCRTRTGSDKGQVESANSALDRMQQLFHGYLGNAAHKRGSEVTAAMSFRAARRIVEEYAHTFYPHLPHSGLPADPLGSTLLTPAQKYLQALARGGVVETAVHPDDVFGLLDSVVVAVHEKTVRCGGLKYSGPELGYITRESDPAGRYEKSVRIYHDPADRSRIFFYSTDRECWCEVRAIHHDGTAVAPFSDVLMDDYLFELRQKRLTMDTKIDIQAEFLRFCNRMIADDSLKWAKDRAALQTAVGHPISSPGARRPDHHTNTHPRDFPIDVDAYEIDEYEMSSLIFEDDDE